MNGLLIGHCALSILLQFGVPVPSIRGGGFVYTLDVFSFTVLSRLDNDGERDVAVSQASVNTLIGFFEINADQGVEVQPVPEPAGTKLMSMGLLLLIVAEGERPRSEESQ